MSVFRLRLGKQYFIGIAEQIQLLSHDMITLYEELYPTTSGETEQKSEESVNAGVNESKRADIHGNSQQVEDEASGTVPENNRSNVIQKKLQPNCQDNGITFTAVSIRFDAERCLAVVCPRIFESLCTKNALESQQDQIPSIFQRMGRATGFKRPKSNSDKDERKTEQRENGGEQRDILDGAAGRDSFLGVEARQAAEILGFLEQPWQIVMPNEPIITKRDVKHMMEQWQAYSQRFMIKLKWMNLIQVPLFVRVTDQMLQNDLPLISTDDEATLLSYCLEFWNKPDMNYHWGISLTLSDTTAAIWKTRMVCKNLL